VRAFSLNEPLRPPGPTDVLVPNPHPLRAVVGDRLVVFDRATSVCHVLNPSAGLILDAVDGRRSVDDLVALLHDETGVDADRLRADVTDALTSFRAEGLVHPAGSHAPPEPPPTRSPGQPDPGDPRAARRQRWAPTVERLLARTDGVHTVGPVGLAGTTLVVRTSDEAVAAATEDLLAPLPRTPPGDGQAPGDDDEADPDDAEHTAWLVPPSSGGRWRVVLDGQVVSAAADGAEALETLMTQLNLVAIAGSTGRVLWHAGAVERDGRVVVVAGESGRGKSTLTAALVQAGFAYVTDELVLLDPGTGRVAPYPKALDLSVDSQRLLGLEPAGDERVAKERVVPTRLGTVSSGGTPTLLVLLGRPDGADPEDTPVATPLAPVDALVELLRSTFAETFAVTGALDVLAALCETVPAIALPRMPVDDAVAAVRTAFEAATPGAGAPAG
jgi:hypothetical protein